jgi:hypothetical protein
MQNYLNDESAAIWELITWLFCNKKTNSAASLSKKQPITSPPGWGCTDKKDNQIFLIDKEIIQSGAVAKSYMTDGLLIYGEINVRAYLRISSYIRKPFLIYDFTTAPLWISLYLKIWFSFLSVYCKQKDHYDGKSSRTIMIWRSRIVMWVAGSAHRWLDRLLGWTIFPGFHAHGFLSPSGIFLKQTSQRAFWSLP